MWGRDLTMARGMTARKLVLSTFSWPDKSTYRSQRSNRCLFNVTITFCHISPLFSCLSLMKHMTYTNHRNKHDRTEQFQLFYSFLSRGRMTASELLSKPFVAVDCVLFLKRLKIPSIIAQKHLHPLEIFSFFARSVIPAYYGGIIQEYSYGEHSCFFFLFFASFYRTALCTRITAKRLHRFLHLV